MKFFEIDVFYSIVSIISLSGCLLHLTDVSSIYFSYETNVNVDFERENMVEIPGVTICTNSTFTLSNEFIDKNYPNLTSLYNDHPAKYYFRGKLLKNLTLNEQLNIATVDYKQIFNSCMIMKPLAFESSEDYIECDEVAPIRQFITYYKKCYSIALQLNNEPSERYIVDHDTTLRDNGFPLFKIILNNEYLDEIVVFIHSRTTPFLGFMGGQTNGVHFNNTKYSSYTLSYVKTTSKLLPPPFKTMCRDYNTIGYKTLSHCILSCKVF